MKGGCWTAKYFVWPHRCRARRGNFQEEARVNHLLADLSATGLPAGVLQLAHTAVAAELAATSWKTESPPRGKYFVKYYWYMLSIGDVTLALKMLAFRMCRSSCLRRRSILRGSRSRVAGTVRHSSVPIGGAVGNGSSVATDSRRAVDAAAVRRADAPVASHIRRSRESRRGRVSRRSRDRGRNRGRHRGRNRGRHRRSRRDRCGVSRGVRPHGRRESSEARW